MIDSKSIAFLVHSKLLRLMVVDSEIDNLPSQQTAHIVMKSSSNVTKLLSLKFVLNLSGYTLILQQQFLCSMS